MLLAAADATSKQRSRDWMNDTVIIRRLLLLSMRGYYTTAVCAWFGNARRIRLLSINNEPRGKYMQGDKELLPKFTVNDGENFRFDKDIDWKN